MKIHKEREQWGRTVSQQGILWLFVKTSQVAAHKTSQLIPNNWMIFPEQKPKHKHKENVLERTIQYGCWNSRLFYLLEWNSNILGYK